MKKRLALKLFFLFLTGTLWAAKLTISGYVVDSKTGETIIGVNVVVRGTHQGTAADGNGYFRITGLEPGFYTIDFIHIGYKKKSVAVELANKSINLKEITLEPEILMMQKVSIIGEKSELADLTVESGYREITARAIRRIPGSRNDVFRAIKLLPGVESIDPFSPLYVVRGSSTGENLILLDGVPIYNPYHFVNSSGLFNVYAIKNVEMMVGGFGAEYGGRNSSVLYVTTREGNNKRLHGELSPGTTASNMAVDFPLGPNVTMMLSGRWYYDLVSRYLLNSPSYFYDINATLSWIVNDRHRLMLKYFHSRDDMKFNSDAYFNYLANTFDTDILDDYDFRFRTNWKNQAATVILKSILTPRVYMQTQFYYSGFSAENRSLIDFYYSDEDSRTTKLYMRTDILGKIQDIGLKSKLDISIADWNNVKTGFEWNRYRFENDMRLNGYSEGAILYKPDLISGFIEDKLNFGRLILRPGFRISQFSSQENWNKELRIAAAWQAAHNIKIKASRGQYLQYIVSINTQEYEVSQFLDTYYPLELKKPSGSNQTILGIEADLTKDLQLSLDFYHKDIYRTYSYDYNASQLEAANFLDKLRAGSGISTGFELQLKGRRGKTSGWISYGYCKSTRNFPHIMGGKTHLFDYDRPHSFKSVVNYQLTNSIEFSGSLQVQSGTPRTLDTGYADYFYYNPRSNQTERWPQVITPIKGNIRMPYTLRLDLGMKKLLRSGVGAKLAEYLGADRAFLNVTFGNLLFLLHRNVWFYLRTDEGLYGLGTNYLPEVSFSYSVQF